MALSDRRILRHKKRGNVVVDPYIRDQLQTSSYDVCLGEWYFRKSDPAVGQTFFSPYSIDHIKKLWGEPQRAEPAERVFSNAGMQIPDGYLPEDLVIFLRPNELILGHTVEFIGGRNVVTAKMQARSTVGRLDFDVCSDAGWGDIGYINRWTMEIRNRNDVHTALKVGSPIAQIAFFYAGATLKGDYTRKGNYQSSQDLEELKVSWDPKMMLPKTLT